MLMCDNLLLFCGKMYKIYLHMFIVMSNFKAENIENRKNYESESCIFRC